MNNHFDTLSAAEALEAAGITPGHARAIIGQMNRVVDENVATKANVRQLETALKADVRQLETALKADVKQLEVALKGELNTKIAEVKGELKEDIARVQGELKAEITHSTNRAIYTLGGLVTVLFILDRIIPLFGIAQ